MIGRSLLARLIASLRRRDLDRKLDAEVLAHLELSERDLLAAGLSPQEARRVARTRFGGIEQMKEQHRDRRAFRSLEMLLKDFRHGLALLIRALSDPAQSL